MENWGTSRFNPNDSQRQVLCVCICAYENISNLGDETGRPPTKHWTVFLELHGGESVKVDIVPGDGLDGLTGTIILESKTYVSTQRAIHTKEYAVTGLQTVQSGRL
ncbi:MAG: hypothetical protein M1829_003708 [Trizodia sp. TS-e1964]|nr:MAG: hypothetical protein M1829_003708 [Trizodia sp. TS-e1964]